ISHTTSSLKAPLPPIRPVFCALYITQFNLYDSASAKKLTLYTPTCNRRISLQLLLNSSLRHVSLYSDTIVNSIFISTRENFHHRLEKDGRIGSLTSFRERSSSPRNRSATLWLCAKVVHKKRSV